MPLRVKSVNTEHTEQKPILATSSKDTVTRSIKKNHPKKITQNVRDRAGVTWDLNNPPSMLAAVAERAIRDPKFPDDERGQALKKKYTDAMPMGLYLFADMLKEYWEHDPVRREAASYYNLHRLRNAGIRGVGYTKRPNLELVGAIAPFCHVSIDNLMLYADDLSISIDKSVNTNTHSPVKSANQDGESVMCETVFVTLLKDAIECYDNDIRVFAVALNLGIAEENKIVRAPDIEEFLATRQPTQTEAAELARLIKHPATCNPDPAWLYQKSLQNCLKHN